MFFFGDEFSLILKHALAASITVQKYNLDGETVTSLSINIKKSRGEAIYITKGTRSREFNYHKSGWLKSFNLRTKSSYSGGMRDVAEFFPKKNEIVSNVSSLWPAQAKRKWTRSVIDIRIFFVVSIFVG